MQGLVRAIKSLHNHRKVVACRLRGVGTRLAYGGAFSAGTAFQVGAGVCIDLYGLLTIGKNVKLSDGCHLVVGPNAELILGDGVFVGRQTVIAAGTSIRIGEGTDIAEQCSIRDSDHALESEDRRAGLAHFAPIVIGNRCWLGAGARILKGSTLGDGVVVGANAVVRGAFEPSVVIGGVPARVLKKIRRSSASARRGQERPRPPRFPAASS